MSAVHGPVKSYKEARSTMWAYVVGFLLSLVFTAIPYYMVVNKTVTGSTLMATILGFAVLQMLVQIFFFLHLGRGPKPLYNVVFFAATVGTILVVVLGSIWIMDHLNYNMASTDVSKYLAEKEGISQIGGEKTGACKGNYKNYKVSIAGGTATPAYIEAKICDTLTFINEDEEVHEISFGTHPQDVNYAGQSELEVRKGRSKTLVLNEAGTYQFHDDLTPMLSGSFTVGPR